MSEYIDEMLELCKEKNDSWKPAEEFMPKPLITGLSVMVGKTHVFVDRKRLNSENRIENNPKDHIELRLKTAQYDKRFVIDIDTGDIKEIDKCPKK
jgi:hypothetical protein